MTTSIIVKDSSGINSVTDLVGKFVAVNQKRQYHIRRADDQAFLAELAARRRLALSAKGSAGSSACG